jgi:DNA-binding CsgD family transcriptional regulator
MLSERNLRVLVCLANGMSKKTTGRVLLLSPDQIRRDLSQIRRELGAKNSAEAVAKAWRLCLISSDEIEGGPDSWFTEILVTEELDFEEALGTYLQRVRYLTPPKESWAELQLRAARIAADYRAGVHRPALRVEGEP